MNEALPGYRCGSIEHSTAWRAHVEKVIVNVRYYGWVDGGVEGERVEGLGILDTDHMG